MYKHIEKGIRQNNSGNYEIYVELPPRKDRKEHSHSFHVGTVKTLDEAKEVKKKVDDICLHIGKNKAFEPLQELKKSLTKKGKLNTYIGALDRLLDDHDRIYGEYTLNNKEPDEEYTEEIIQEWKDERAALVMAIEMFKKRR